MVELLDGDRLRPPSCSCPAPCASASVTFSSTVRCGKAFHCWKTMPILCRSLLRSVPSGVDLGAVDEDLPALDRLEPVDAHQQRRLARARAADDRDHLALLNGEADAVEHLEAAETFPDVFRSQSFSRHRFSSRAPRRAIGKLMRK